MGQNELITSLKAIADSFDRDAVEAYVSMEDHHGLPRAEYEEGTGDALSSASGRLREFIEKLSAMSESK